MNQNSCSIGLKIVLLAACCLGMSHRAIAQGTTAVGLHVGLSAVYYKSKVAAEKSQQTFFLPHFNLEVKRSGENVFYGSIGVGVVPRRIPFYTFENGDKIGIQAPEFYAFVKTGLQARSSFLTHLPYLCLGISRLDNAQSYYSSSYHYSSLDTSTYANYFQFKPYVEIGNTMLNSTYVEDKRNILLTLSLRYYPTALFKSNIIYQLDYNDVHQANFQLIEFIVTMGIQQNFHRRD